MDSSYYSQLYITVRFRDLIEKKELKSLEFDYETPKYNISRPHWYATYATIVLNKELYKIEISTANEQAQFEKLIEYMVETFKIYEELVHQQ